MDSGQQLSADRKITLLVADDHAIVRRGLITLLSLNERMQVVGEAEDGRAAVELAARLEPDVVLMDISMPVLNGLEATRQIRKQLPDVKILILTAHDNEEYVLDVVRSGANGYVLKNSSAEDLFYAIQSVHSGHAFFSPSVSKILVNDYLKSRASGSNGGAAPKSDPRLTAREREVLQLVAEGETHQRDRRDSPHQRQDGGHPLQQHHEKAGYSRYGRPGYLCHQKWHPDSSTIIHRSLYVVT